MHAELTDNEIVAGLKSYNESITQEYFYGYCRMAYRVYRQKYALWEKPDMDFYSLAHEYYLYLDKHEWQPLMERSPEVSLRTWMGNGFRFLILDKLKGWEKEHRMTTVLEGANTREIAFNVADADYKKDIEKMLTDLCYGTFGQDSVSAVIIRMMLVDGYKGKEVAEKLGITPSAVSQRYHRIMEEVVRPYFVENYEPQMSYCEDRECMLSLTLGPQEVGSKWGSKVALPGIFVLFKGKEKMEEDLSRRTTPHKVRELAEGEIFVFGSNLAGAHGGGAAYAAMRKYGAVWGQGVGLQGQSYAIPTMQGGVETIAPYVDEFIEFAKAHKELRFLVTAIGCGIAGFSPREIAPLFAGAVMLRISACRLRFGIACASYTYNIGREHSLGSGKKA